MHLRGDNASAFYQELYLESREYKRVKYHCTVDLLFDWFGLVCFAKKNIVSCHTVNCKPVKQEVNSTVVRPPLVFPIEPDDCDLSSAGAADGGGGVEGDEPKCAGRLVGQVSVL